MIFTYTKTSPEKIIEYYNTISLNLRFTEIFNALSLVGAILDTNRQIVYANNEFLSLTGKRIINEVLGKRPGEVLSCIHSDTPLGCGSLDTCIHCGAYNAITESQLKKVEVKRETRITTKKPDGSKGWDLLVTSKPFGISGQNFFIFFVKDISSEKRRAALEHVFFHDLLNLVTCLSGMLNVISEQTESEDTLQLIKLSEKIARNIEDEINSHKNLRDAESGNLKPKYGIVNTLDILKSVVEKMNFIDAAKYKKIVITDNATQCNIITDISLLQRVLINLIKNAIEASEENSEITVGVEDMEKEVKFWIKNSSILAEDIRLQIFQRSFSTKGVNRGLGTYSAKLFVEEYLGGKVFFTSSNSQGTVFNVVLKKEPYEKLFTKNMGN